MDDKILPVILSGGTGTRLWPLSRPDRPKQFLSLTEERSMLQATVARISAADGFAAPLVIGNALQADEIDAQMGGLDLVDYRIVLEPSGRNTAPAVALAALLAEPQQLMLVMPSDHMIARPSIFLEAVRSLLPFAAEGWLGTFGVRPSRPETGYGYIRRGAELMSGIFAAAAFVEKPDAETAALYLEDGRYDWNAGIFLFRADRFLEELERHEPAMLEAARHAVEQAKAEGRRVSPDAKHFRACPSISIDYAVMERAQRVAVVPTDMSWSDVGSWDALYEIGAKDEFANVISGRVSASGSRGCLFRSEGPRITVVGVEDLVVIALADEVLIVPRSKAQLVKETAEKLGS